MRVQCLSKTNIVKKCAYLGLFFIYFRLFEIQITIFTTKTCEDFFKNGQPRPLFRLFMVFSNKQYKFYNKSMWKMSCPSSTWCRDSNSRPLEHESPPITTGPGFGVKYVLIELKDCMMETSFCRLEGGSMIIGDPIKATRVVLGVWIIRKTHDVENDRVV